METPAGQPEHDEFYQPPLLQPTLDRPNKQRPLVVLWDGRTAPSPPQGARKDSIKDVIAKHTPSGEKHVPTLSSSQHLN